MANSEYKIPKEWSDELVELRQHVAGLPEDNEDRLIREGEARVATMTPEEQARVIRIGDEILKRMQAPE